MAAPRPAATPDDAQARANAAVWRRMPASGPYTSRELRPVEVILLARWSGALGGRVLELGCGAGRLTGYLAELAERVTAIDMSRDMVQRCRAACPGVDVREGDLRDLSGHADRSYDAVVAGWNVADVLGDGERRRLLAEVHRLLEPEGLLILSSHNRGHLPRMAPPTHVRTDHPLRLAADLVRMPRRLRNHRRLAALERDLPSHALVNDSAHDYTLLHYYVSRDAQQRQFEQAGFELLECRDLDGRLVGPGDDAADCSELHYVARARA